MDVIVSNLGWLSWIIFGALAGWVAESHNREQIPNGMSHQYYCRHCRGISRRVGLFINHRSQAFRKLELDSFYRCRAWRSGATGGAQSDFTSQGLNNL